MSGKTAQLLAISDIHVSHKENQKLINKIIPVSDEDWLIIAGDVCESSDDLVNVLQILTKRFEKVIWVPGNHELYSTAKDSIKYHGQSRYENLVLLCRELGVVTPEDEYLLWEKNHQTVQIVPMFTLYDYSFLPVGFNDWETALVAAREKNIYATDEFLILPEPYNSKRSWCFDRVAYTESRLELLDSKIPKVLINHWPLVQDPTRLLWQKEFSLWCGTQLTKTWHIKYNALAVVYGHLHIPHTAWYDGVRFEEVSLGYPREWKIRGMPTPFMRRILPNLNIDLSENNR